MRYRGRFAPTPSGPLHHGSLLTAVAGFLQARSTGGAWLLRIDDLDRSRSRTEYIETILRQLEAHGLHWDETLRRQSQHLESYEAAFEMLRQQGRLYPCVCSRTELARTSVPGPDGPVYAGTCRNRFEISAQAKNASPAWRIRIGDALVALEDPCQGPLLRSLANDVGDFILRRADGEIAYQLACVIDEREQAITEVVRGADLIGSSIRQRHLMQLLGQPPPNYLHVPLLLDADGRKLSKQNHALPIDQLRPEANLSNALVRLGQSPPDALWQAPIPEILDWAIRNWSIQRLPRTTALQTQHPN